MRSTVFILATLAMLNCFSQADAIHIIPDQLIENKMDWAKFENPDPKIKRQILTELIDQNLIFLCYSGAFQGEKDLDKFMATHAKSYHLVDLDADGEFELVFNGYDCNDSENEFLYIYLKKEGKYVIGYTKKGNIIGYNVNPNTKELLLIHFNYPCCKNGTNNLNTLRLVKNQITEYRKEFFAGRQDYMKGPFLPEAINKNGEIITTTKTIELRWSPAVIDTLAWEGVINKNIIIAFPTGSKFRVLASQTNDKGEVWLFVLSKSKPLVDKRYIIEPSNFLDSSIYGWVQKGKY